MEAREFEFNGGVFTFRASLGVETLALQMGPRRPKLRLSELRHLYVKEHGAGLCELVLSYEPAPGKHKRLRVSSREGEPGFDALVKALLEGRPEIDLRHLDDKAAFAQMGAMDTQRVVMFLFPILVTLVFALIFSPKLIHGFDSGKQAVSVSELAEGRELTTRNLAVEGIAVWPLAIEVTTTRSSRGSGTTSSQTHYVPLVAAGWGKTEPVHVVLETASMPSAGGGPKIETFEGVLRNIWWEGLDGDEKEFFENELGVRMADDVLLFESGASPGRDLAMAGGLVGFVFALTVAMAVVMARKRRSALATA